MLAALPGILLTGCSESQPVSTVAEAEYTGELTDTVLRGLNTGDYAAFSENFDEAMKKALPEPAFQQLRNKIPEASGDYVSKEHVSTQPNVQNLYTVLTYRVKYTREDGVKVTITFLETENGVFVSSLFFDSSNLR